MQRWYPSGNEQESPLRYFLSPIVLSHKEGSMAVSIWKKARSDSFIDSLHRAIHESNCK